MPSTRRPVQRLTNNETYSTPWYETPIEAVARDLAPLGYEVVVFDGETKAGGLRWIDQCSKSLP